MPFPPVATLWDRIRDTADRNPDRPALHVNNQTWSYGELMVAVASTSRILIEGGVRPGDRVGISMDRKAGLVVALLSLWSRGAAYVPLDPNYPQARNGALASAAGVRTVLCDAARPPRQNGAALDEIVLTDQHPREGDLLTFGSGPASAHDAYIITTSGSTGRPKAIRVDHANIAFFADAMSKVIRLSRDDVVLARTSVSFDPHVLEIFLPLAAGAQVVLLPQHEVADPDAIARAVDRHGVTLVQATPSLWKRLVDIEWPRGHVARGLCGGEAMNADLAERIRSTGRFVPWNLYGPTETTVWCAAAEVPDGATPHIGGVLPGVVFALHPRAGCTSDSDPPELWIGGPGVARGYVGSTDDTAFVNDRDGRRWYRTGDCLRPTSEGAWEFAGRVDRQIKVRGHRVEPSEIEQVIARVPEVVAAAVVHADDRLIAAIVASSVPAGDLLERVRRELTGHLPEYMVPSAMFLVDAIPLTVTEKVDAVRVLELANGSARTPVSTSHEDALDLSIARLWCDVIGISTVGPDERFAEVGGHSLHLIDLRVKIRRLFGIDVGLAELRDLDTVAKLSARLRQMERDAADFDGGSMMGDRTATITLSTSCIRFFEEVPSDERHLNVLQLLVRVKQPAGEVRRAVERILQLHDVFRTESVQGDGPLRFLLSLGDDPLQSLSDVSALHDTLDDFLLAAQSSYRTLDIARGPLHRTIVFSRNGTTWVSFVLHHLIADDISLDILRYELDLLLDNPEASVPHTSSLATWTRLQVEAWPTIRMQEVLPTWLAMTAPDHVGGWLPPGRRTDDDTLSQARVVVEHHQSGLGLLGVVERSESVVAAAALTMRRVFAMNDVGIRLVHSGRGRQSNVEDSLTVGWLAHHVPLAVDLRPDVPAVVSAVRADMRRLLHIGPSYQVGRFVQAHESLRRSVQLWELPLYVNYLPLARPSRRFDDITAELLSPVQVMQRITGLAVVCRDTGSSLIVSVHANRDTVPQAWLSDYVEHFAQMCAEVGRTT